MAGLRAAALSGLFVLSAFTIGQTVPPAAPGKTQESIFVPLATTVAPFVGTHSETFEEFSTHQFGSNVLPIFGGWASLSGTMMEIAQSGQFGTCGIGLKASDGMQLLGMLTAGGSFTIAFSEPVSAFGGYWASAGTGCDTPQYSSKVTFAFFDVEGKQLEADAFVDVNGDSTPVWRGYTFAVPVKSVTISGDYIAADGMQVIPAATPPYYTPTPTDTPSATPTSTPSDTPGMTPTATPTETPTPTATATATAPPSPTGTPSDTPGQAVATPIISPNGGTFRRRVTVKISDTTAGAIIYYTLDGSDPTTASSIYSRKSKGIKLSGVGSHTVKARATATGFNESDVATAVFDIN